MRVVICGVCPEGHVKFSMTPEAPAGTPVGIAVHVPEDTPDIESDTGVV